MNLLDFLLATETILWNWVSMGRHPNGNYGLRSSWHHDDVDTEIRATFLMPHGATTQGPTNQRVLVCLYAMPDATNDRTWGVGSVRLPLNLLVEDGLPVLDRVAMRYLDALPEGGWR